MKKLAIAGSAVALAAMPVVSTFAAVQSTVTDTVQLTVNKTCQMEATSASATYNLGDAVAGSEYAATNGSAMTLTCNSVKGWTLKATATALSDSAQTPTTSQTIPFGAYATTGSVWSAGIAVTGADAANATIATGWNTTGEGAYSATTASSTTILSSVADTTGAKAVKEIVVTPSYKAYAQANQAAATYSGTMIYTFAENQ